MAECEIRAAVPDHDGFPTMKRYDPESETWAVIHEGPPEDRVILLPSQEEANDIDVQYLDSDDGIARRLSWWRRILYRIALSRSHRWP